MTLQNLKLHSSAQTQMRTLFSQNTRYQPYFLRNLKKMPQYRLLSEEQIFDIEVVARVLPFRTNNYVIDELINWDDIPNDPLFILNFPQKGMLIPRHYDEVAGLLKKGVPEEEINQVVSRIRLELSPHPAGQLTHNRPTLNGEVLKGMQHKYRETVLFFPSQGQTCHAFCTFCFRWPQFVGEEDTRFAMREVEPLIAYLKTKPDVSDILFTGGDPLFMKTKALAEYIDPILDADLESIRTIRIGTKTLSYWPYRFLTDPDADELLSLFKKIVDSGKHLAIMAHFNHPRELQTEAVQEAIARLRAVGVQIRTQSPVLNHINNDPKLCESMLQQQF